MKKLAGEVKCREGRQKGTIPAKIHQKQRSWWKCSAIKPDRSVTNCWLLACSFRFWFSIAWCIYSHPYLQQAFLWALEVGAFSNSLLFMRAGTSVRTYFSFPCLKIALVIVPKIQHQGSVCCCLSKHRNIFEHYVTLVMYFSCCSLSVSGLCGAASLPGICCFPQAESWVA